MTGKGQGGSWVPTVVSSTGNGKFHASPAALDLIDLMGRLLRSDDPAGIQEALAHVALSCGADVAQFCRAVPGGDLETCHHWARDPSADAPRTGLALPVGETPLVLRDRADAGDAALRAQLEAAGLRSVVAIPALRQEALAGNLLLGWRSQGPGLPPEDLAVLRSLVEAMLAAAERRDHEGRHALSLQALQDDRMLLEAILRTSNSAIIAFDGEARIVFANEEAAGLLGTEPKALRGCTLEGIGCRLLSRDGEPLAPEAMPVRQAMAEGHALRGLHHVLIGADGRQRILSVNAAPVAGGDGGGGVRVVATVDDVTGQVSADSALRTALAEAHQLAFFDPLTGLYNRRGVVEVLRDCLQICARENSSLALLYIDIDGMRQVNGTRGHWLGDRVLQALAARLEDLRHDGCDLGRISADEFVLTCSESHPDPASAVAAAEVSAERVLTELRKPLVVDGLTIEITVSIGLAAITAEDTVEGLLKGVDLAVMAAKAAGGDRACAYRPDMEQDMVGRVALAQELREAIRRDEFRIFFEPMVRLGDGGLEVVGQEALIRWQHPVRGLLSPVAFIPFAEETGFIRDIDRWVLRAAALELARWADDPERRHLRLSINISSAQFLSDEFGQMVREVLAETGVDPTRVELEVTEGTLLSNLGLARATMMDLRSLGLSIALDDFGTGFSSLSYLRDLPVDVLKIDRSFLGGLSESKANRTILEGIIGLASGLGVALVAEGVETTAQFAWLRAKGCRTFQGYLFGRPTDAPQLTLPPEVEALAAPASVERAALGHGQG
ncbi:EAL domain-containing protein [Cereibacter azotoformans]|uniref:Diguanylate cyclase/phosphodiesterase n=1 Tax=Cereibacter azotoformans TaxID=43057 RepID=A0A2T5K0B2_9RHOB|nr:EAL domain-containing protein [Cereibacter azotoformans]AXQ93068.1 EAL domain-containing protein [Cereibacter sphaeroides]MBO4169236.1 EAL domain-containing protein [Cereibacter azotoformans]PTR15872.1 diguanylate cyclase/phosphodiesterase [Cereibacter azotoformans]UIJ31374.1 EAL domain-containing protein [Cereibacter azotoformans]